MGLQDLANRPKSGLARLASTVKAEELSPIPPDYQEHTEDPRMALVNANLDDYQKSMGDSEREYLQQITENIPAPESLPPSRYTRLDVKTGGLLPFGAPAEPVEWRKIGEQALYATPRIVMTPIARAFGYKQTINPEIEAGMAPSNQAEKILSFGAEQIGSAPVYALSEILAGIPLAKAASKGLIRLGDLLPKLTPTVEKTTPYVQTFARGFGMGAPVETASALSEGATLPEALKSGAKTGAVFGGFNVAGKGAKDIFSALRRPRMGNITEKTVEESRDLADGGPLEGPRLKTALPEGVGAQKGLTRQGSISAAKFTIPEKQSLIPGTNQRVRSFQVTGMKSSISSPETKSGLLMDTYEGGPGAYTRISHTQTEEGARQFFKEQGLDESINYVLHSPDVSSYKTGLAKEVIQFLESNGASNQAIDVYESVAEQLTKAGQMTEAAKLFNALTPKGVVLKGVRDTKKAYEKLPQHIKAKHQKATEQVKQAFDEINKEAVEQVISDTPQLGGTVKRTQARKPNLGKIKKEPDPAEMLAQRIKQYVTSPDAGSPEAVEAKKIVSTLFGKAREVMPKKQIVPTKTNELERVATALNSNEKYREVWEEAKSILQKKHGDFPQIMKDVEAYIEHYLNVPYSERSLDRILKGAIKDTGFSVEKSAFGAMSPTFESGSPNDLIKLIIAESGLTGRNAETLAMELGSKLEGMLKGTKDKKTSQLAEQILKLSEQRTTKGKTDPIKEMFKTLLQKARENTPKATTRKPQGDPMLPVFNALNNRYAFNVIWAETKKELAKKLKSMGISVEGANLDQLFSELLYHPYSKTQLDKAVRGGIKDYGVNIGQLVREHFTKQEGALQDLAQKLVTRGWLTKDEAAVLSQDITRRLTEITSAKKQQILDQIFRQRGILPIKKTVDQKIIEWSNLGALSNEQYRRLVAEKMRLPVLTEDLANQLRAFADQAQQAKGREADILRAKITDLIAQQIPTPFWRKVASIQTMAQLLNPKTAIRNIGGNVGFAALENISGALGAAIDRPLSLITGQRTKVIPSLTAQTKGFKQGWKHGLEDALLGIDTSGIASKFDLPRGRVFRSGPLGFAEKALNIELRATDRAFYQAAYEDSLLNQMRAAKTNTPTEEMRNIAHLDGLYRTFQDDNALSNLFVGIKRVLNANKEFGIGDFIIKYPRTPANLLARGLDYSPAGFVKVILEAARPLAKQKFNQKAFVESFSRALVGSTALFGTGALLHKLGIITGRAPEDRDLAELQRQQGFGEYRINVSALKRLVFGGGSTKPQKGDKIISYDWFQPQAIPVAIGADINANKGTSKGIVGTLLAALNTGINAFAEQPVVQGIQTLFSGGYGDWTTGLVKVLEMVPSSFVPTLLSQVRQLLDNQRRETYSPAKGQEAINRAVAKIPGLANRLPQKYGTLGQPLETYQDGGNTPLNVFLNPAFVNTYNPSREVQKVFDLYEQTGETKQVPRIVDKSITVSGKKFVLSGQEYANYQRLVGEYTQQGFAKMPGNLKPEDAVKKMQDIMTDANTKAKTEILKARGERVYKKGSGIAVK